MLLEKDCCLSPGAAVIKNAGEVAADVVWTSSEKMRFGLYEDRRLADCRKVNQGGNQALARVL